MGDLIGFFMDFILHLDKHLADFTSNYGLLTYLLLFLIIFLETGLVVAPFLPGDSLLFAAGALAALPDSGLSLFWLWILLVVAAVLGDTANYHIGKLFGNKLTGRVIKQKHIDKTEAFFAKHGGKTIIIARFIPIVRTIAPFVAGVGHMKYRYFISYNIVGGLAWVTLFLLGGFFFGNIPVVQENFSLVIIAIIAVSVTPALIAWLNNRRKLMRLSGWLLTVLGGGGLIAATIAKGNAQYDLPAPENTYTKIIDMLFFSSIGILIFGVFLLILFYFRSRQRVVDTNK